jgi:hypothetical protein
MHHAAVIRNLPDMVAEKSIDIYSNIYLHLNKKQNKTNSVALVRKRTILTDLQLNVQEISNN